MDHRLNVRRSDASAFGANAVRLAVLDLSRVTEQVAILSSLAAGRKHRSMGAIPTNGSIGGKAETKGGSAKNDGTLRKLSASAFLECIRWSMCPGVRVVRKDPKWLGFDEKLGTNRRTRGFESLWSNCEHPETGTLVGEPGSRSVANELDIVATPIDGVEPLLEGRHAGSVSVVVGGPTGCFDALPQSQVGEFKRYFVIATGPDQVASLVQSALGERVDSTDQAQPVESVGIFRRLFDDLADLHDKRRLSDIPACISTVRIEKRWGLVGLLKHRFRLHVTDGSPFAAAIGVYGSQRSAEAFAAVVRETTAFQIATAARAMDRQFFAIPVKDDPSGIVVVPPEAPVFTASHFVNTNDVFVIMTGITSSPAVRGVRLLSHGEASTESIAVNGMSRSSRRVRHERNLAVEFFRAIDGSGQLRPANEVVGDFLDRLG